MGISLGVNVPEGDPAQRFKGRDALMGFRQLPGIDRGGAHLRPPGDRGLLRIRRAIL